MPLTQTVSRGHSTAGTSGVCRFPLCNGTIQPMQKSLTVGFQLLAAALILAGYSPAQTPSSTPTQSTSSQSSSSGQTGTSGKTTAGAAKKPASSARKAAPLTLKTDKEKQSYAMGMNLGTGLHRQGMTLDPALVARGLKDAQSGAKTLMTEEEARAALTQLQTSVRQKMQAKAQEEGEANRKAGEAFLAANKAKPGVVTLPSGLEYKVLTEGNGPKPTASDTVSCNYRGTLIDGKEFDSSYKRGQPAQFQVGGVIKGWTEALQLMPVGSKWELFLPPDLAYGERGDGPDIGPDETLIFEVELLSIVEPQKK
jgi:FKBP-type peptidyl-prolyl cis-trans isomerase FklB